MKLMRYVGPKADWIPMGQLVFVNPSVESNGYIQFKASLFEYGWRYMKLAYLEDWK